MSSFFENLLLVVGLLIFVLINVMAFTYIERRVLGKLQNRIGPNRVGPAGIFQPLADALKLFFKETIVPADSLKFLFLLAPAVTLIPALLAYAVIPFDRGLVLSNMSAGLLYLLALSVIGTFGIVLGGISSGNRYSFLGALRSAAQVVSYEINLVLGVGVAVLLAGSANPMAVVEAQDKVWFGLLMPLPAVFFFLAGVAETNRLPFDLPECESELVAGFHTEYGGIRFALYFLAEYSNMFLVSCLTVLLFFGGWRGPLLPGWFWFLVKSYFLMFLFFWFRGTLPRLRYDRLMSLSWKVFFPIMVISLLAAAWHRVSASPVYWLYIIQILALIAVVRAAYPGGLIVPRSVKWAR